MAIEFMEAVWQISPHKAEKLLVQLACADWADGNGEFWPTYDAIAKKTRTTKPGVIRIIEQLLNEGEIVLVEKGGGRGKTTAINSAKITSKQCPQSVKLGSVQERKRVIESYRINHRKG